MYSLQHALLFRILSLAWDPENATSVNIKTPDKEFWSMMPWYELQILSIQNGTLFLWHFKAWLLIIVRGNPEGTLLTMGSQETDGYRIQARPPIPTELSTAYPNKRRCVIPAPLDLVRYSDQKQWPLQISAVFFESESSISWAKALIVICCWPI